jgi:hypothetical protein
MMGAGRTVRSTGAVFLRLRTETNYAANLQGTDFLADALKKAAVCGLSATMMELP